MKAVLGWAVLCAIILLASLMLREIPDNHKGPALTTILFIVTAGLLVQMCRGSK